MAFPSRCAVSNRFDYSHRVAPPKKQPSPATEDGGAAGRAAGTGDDPAYDLADDVKNRLEPELRTQARAALREGRPRDRNRLNARADEISKLKSRRGHQGRDH